MLPKVTLGSTELKVSKLCYGTNMFGTAVDQGRANELLDTFVSLGGNFIDTARSYGDWVPNVPKGASERAIGAWLKNRPRDSVVIATKGAMLDLRAGDWAPRVNPQAIAADLNESLEHLQVSTIDLYWLHLDDPSQPVGPIVDALIAHQQAGRIRYFGASNWTPARITEAQNYAKSRGHQGFVAIQPFWGLAAPNREVAAQTGYGLYYEDGLQPLHQAGMTVVPYSSQSRGFFSKLAQGEAQLPKGLADIYLNDVNRRRFKAVTALAGQRGVPVSELVLAYLTSQPYPTLPIIGASRPEQLKDSVKALDIKLTAPELEQLRTGA